MSFVSNIGYRKHLGSYVSSAGCPVAALAKGLDIMLENYLAKSWGNTYIMEGAKYIIQCIVYYETYIRICIS